MQLRAYNLAALQQVLALGERVDPLARVLYGVGVEIIRAHRQVDLEIAIRAEENVSIWETQLRWSRTYFHRLSAWCKCDDGGVMRTSMHS
jgi:hypothetical protein